MNFSATIFNPPVRVLFAVPAIIVAAASFALAGKATPDSGCTVTDIDGNRYATVKIGTQIWMAENLKTTRLNDGTRIPQVKDPVKWNKLPSPGYCWYDNDAKNGKTFGALYNWYTVHTEKLAPEGWHLPSDGEWTILEKYLMTNERHRDTTAGENTIGKSLAAATHWNVSTLQGVIGNDLAANNSSGFSGLPGGYRDFGGRFYNINSYAIWWSATEFDQFSAWARCLYSNNNSLYRTYDVKTLGFSVRCVKD